MKTYMSTDWIEVRDHGSVYMAKVFLTDDNEAYLICKFQGGMKFFKVDPELLKLGELGFFEKVMEGAEELTTKEVAKIGLIDK